MYTIKMDGKLVYSSEFPDEHISNAVVNRSENQAGSFSITFMSDADIHGSYTMMKSICEVYRDDDLIFYGRPISESHDFYNSTTVEMEGELGFLFDSIQGTDDVSGKQPKEILELLLNHHNAQTEDWKHFHVGNVTVVDTTSNANYHPDDPYAMYPTDDATSKIACNYGKTFDELNSLLIGRLGGFLNVRHESDGMYIDYLKDYNDYSVNDGQVIEFGTNLLDYSDSMSYSGICTGVIPLGGHGDADPYEMYQTDDAVRLTVASVNGGSEIIWNQDLVNTYGKILSVLDLNNINDPKKLFDKGTEYLNDKQFDKLTLNCKIVDLSFVDKAQKPVKFLDKVRIISKPHGLDKYFPVSEISYDLLNPENDTVTLGVTVNALTDGLIKQETSLNSQNHDIQTNTHVINQNAKGWWKEVHDTEGHSRFDIMADKISSEVTRATTAEGNLSSRITQTADSITSEVSRATQAEGNLSSKINQTADSIMSTVEAQGQSISSVRQTAEGVQISVNNLKTGLSNGTTTINGGCITTGSIDADKIKTSYISSLGTSVHFSDSIFTDGGIGAKAIAVDGSVGATGTITGSKLWAGSSGIYDEGGLDVEGALKARGLVYINNPVSFSGTSSMRLLCVSSGGGIVGEISWTELLSILDNHYQKKK